MGRWLARTLSSVDQLRDPVLLLLLPSFRTVHEACTCSFVVVVTVSKNVGSIVGSYGCVAKGMLVMPSAKPLLFRSKSYL